MNLMFTGLQGYYELMYRFGKASTLRQEDLHPDLIKVLQRAMSMQIMDFTIICGVRTPTEQKNLYEQGRNTPGPIVTWTMNSKHFKQSDGYGHAVDIAPYPIRWTGDELKFSQLAGIIKSCAFIEGVDLEWGGDWSKPDMPHFQLKGD